MSALVPVTVLIQTKNEEVAIEACIEGVRAFGEIIVVDSLSSDRTAELSSGAGARVVNFEWNGAYPKKKQWQLENVETSYEWILFLDADETPSTELVESIRAVVTASDVDEVAAGKIALEYHFAGKALKFGHRVTKTVLLRRGKARFPVMNDLTMPGMGELEGHYQPECDGEVRSLAGLLEHNDPDPVRTWFDRHNRYSDWEAHLRMNSEARAEIAASRSSQGTLFNKVPFKPLVFFTYSYVLRLGFLDGRAGFDYAFALAAYYWQIGLKTRELQRARALGPAR